MCEAVSYKCFSFKDAWCTHCVKPLPSTPNTSTPFSKNEKKNKFRVLLCQMELRTNVVFPIVFFL